MLNELDKDIFQQRAEWTFEDIERLRKALKMTEHGFADAVGLTHRYIYVNVRLGNDRYDKRPVMGARASQRVNRFVMRCDSRYSNWLNKEKPSNDIAVIKIIYECNGIVKNKTVVLD